MAKATILDRLAGAMKTLGKREGKALTPRHPEDNWPSPYDMQDSEVFESMDEFPDDFDYMWRY